MTLQTDKRRKGEVYLKQYKIAICDEEVDYAFSLMNYINGEKEQPCLAMAFTNPQNLREYLEQNSVDLLLIGDHIEVEFSEKTPVLWLADGQELAHEEGLYKYQAAERLLREIIDKVTAQVQSKNSISKVRREDFKVYGIYSPVGRCGKTNLAMGICHYQEGRSLYVGFEEYGSFPDERGISQEILYYIKNRDAGFHLRLNQFIVQEHGCYMVPSPKCYLDLRQITSDDIMWFLEQLIYEGTYQTIVFDIGTGSLSDLHILELFDKILVPILEEPIAQFKKEQFLQFIEQSSFIQWKEKMVFLNVPDVSYESLKMEEYLSTFLLKGISYGG